MVKRNANQFETKMLSFSMNFDEPCQKQKHSIQRMKGEG